MVSKTVLERILLNWINTSIWTFLTYSGRLRFQAQIEKKQMLFTVTKLNTLQTGVFTYQPNKSDWIFGPDFSYSGCLVDRGYLIDIDIWSVLVGETSLVFDDESIIFLLEGHNFPCTHLDGFSKSLLERRYTVVWLPGEFCLKFHISGFIVRMPELNKRYSLETDYFWNHWKKQLKSKKCTLPTVFPCYNSPLKTTASFLLRLEIFPKKHFP